MDSNEKEFNSIGNEENAEKEINENVAEEAYQPKTGEIGEEAENSEPNDVTEAENTESADAESDDAAEAVQEINSVEEIGSEEVYGGETDETEIGEGSAESEEDAVSPEDVETEDETKKKSSAPIIAVIIVLALIVAGLAYTVFGNKGNKYNNLGYVNVSGRTIQEIADSAGIELKDFLSEYSLPEDMPSDTTEIAAIYSMPAKVYLQNMIGISFDDMKQAMNIPEETTPNEPKTLGEKIKSIFVKEKTQKIDENTPWYVVEGELTVGDYSGGSLDQFKEFYGLGDDVTEETKMKEVQPQINKKTAEMLAEQQKSEQEQGASGDENTDGNQESAAPEQTDGAENADNAGGENTDTQAQDNAE